METEKQDFDSDTLEQIHRILEALKKSDDIAVKRVLEEAFRDE